MSIDFTFRVRRADFELDVSHSIPDSGITAIFGESGSGKTSLLRLIAGLDKSSDGRIQIGSQAWQSDETFTATNKRGVGFVFQESSLFEHLSVKDNLNYAFTRSAKTILVEHVVELTQIGSLLTRSPVTLSGGEKQRVAIARALCSSPQILLMDEPLAALDRDSKQRILPLIETLSRELNMPILYVSHALEEVARLADYLLLMQSGKVIGSGDIQTMLTTLDYPLAQSLKAESLIDAVVAEHDQAFNLTYLDSPVGRFSIAKKDIIIGARVRVMIAARDLSITKEHQRDTSILNIFAAQVAATMDSGESQVTVKLIANSIPILARITKKSASLLSLSVGDAVFLQAKSVALL